MRNFTVIDAAQRSPQWFQARAGRLTASSAKDMLATIKTGEAAARRDLRTRLVCERLTGALEDDGFINAAMQWGIDHEAAAFSAYEGLTGNMATRVGFIAHNTIMAGCSPDGVLDDCRGGLELKCPKQATHLGYLRGNKVCPPEYVPQLVHSMWVTGAEYWDFMSFDPRFPPELQVFYARVERDEKAIAEYEAKALAFLAEVDTEVSSLKGWKVVAA